MLTSGPNRLKKADLLEPALQKLIDANRLSYFLGYPGLNNSPRKKGTLMLLLHDNYYGQIVRGNAPFNFKPL